MTAPAAPSPRKLALASLAAALVALVVLVTAILPAEYGLDPTGIGAATGFKRLSDPPGATDVFVEPQDGPTPLYSLSARWELLELPIATQDGYSSRTRTEERVTLPLNVTNLTSLTARLSWNDTDRIDGQGTEPDLFELSIRGPGGKRSQLVQARNEPGGEGNVTVTLPWQSVPYPQENATQGLVIPTRADASGVGDWTFVVRLYSAGSLPNASALDPGNAWTLTVTAEAYELNVTKSEGRMGDRVRLTLQPGQGIEYKFAMGPGDAMTYRWESTAPLSWDFHAEEEGKDPEDFTRYAEGTSAGESGDLTAPFHGRHGWYWLNRGTSPVTITLETTGTYTILGVPR